MSSHLITTLYSGTATYSAQPSTQMNLAPTLIEKASLHAFSQMSQESVAKIKVELVKQINTLNENSPDIIDSINTSELDRILKDDSKTNYSLVTLDAENKIEGFILARESQESSSNKAPESVKVVFIEKLVIIKQSDRQRGLGTTFLHSIAKCSKQNNVNEIRLLVYKANRAAITFYFNRGFDYVDKKFDEQWDAYLLKVSPETLLERTSEAVLILK